MGHRTLPRLTCLRSVAPCISWALAAAWLPAAGAGGARIGADAYPPLPGVYTPSPQHPRVFTTRADLDNLAKRTGAPNSFSARMFHRLADQTTGDLSAKVDWDANYSGCDIDIYLHAFSYEPRGGYATEIRTEQQMGAAMKVHAGLGSPAGAAVVASRLALYAALVHAGASSHEDASTERRASMLAKTILLAWADHGFRDAEGHLFHSASQFCQDNGRPDEVDVGLQIGRGVIHSVHAQDLLESIGALDAAETARLDAFHSAMFDVIRQAADFRYRYPYPACERYSNHVTAALAGLLAIARLQDDGRKFEAVLKGNDRGTPVPLPWIAQFDHAIYGESDSPIGCYPNTGADSLRSRPSYQTATVAPGEIEDRYRNADPSQGIGYSMSTLQNLFDAAEIMRHAGIDAYGYRGAHRQSIEMATQYYACYGTHVGFGRTVTPDNSKACPGSAQYIGDTVNGLESAILIGAFRFPGNGAITALEAAAKAEVARDSLDPIRFGMWND